MRWISRTKQRDATKISEQSTTPSRSWTMNTETDAENVLSRFNTITDIDLQFQVSVDHTNSWNDLLYSEEDPRSHLDGFHGNMTEAQSRALDELQDIIASNGLDLSLIQGEGQLSEPLRLLYLRFLRANGFNPSKAYSQLESNVRWRIDENLRELLKKQPADVLECNPISVSRYFPHWNFGEDRVGRPVLCKQYGGFIVSELVQITSIDNMVKSHVWEQEMVMRLMRLHSLSKGHIIDSVVVIIDTGGMSMRQVTSDFITLMKRVAYIDQAMYPELLGEMFIINTPSLFSYVWKIFSPLLDVRTREKIKIYSKPQEWQPALLEIIPEQVLPPEYGGIGLPLSERKSIQAVHENGFVLVESPFTRPDLIQSMTYQELNLDIEADNEPALASNSHHSSTNQVEASFVERATGAVSSIALNIFNFWTVGSSPNLSQSDIYSPSSDPKARSDSINSEEFFDVMANIDESDVQDVVVQLQNKFFLSNSNHHRELQSAPIQHNLPEEINGNNIRQSRVVSWAWRTGPFLTDNNNSFKGWTCVCWAKLVIMWMYVSRVWKFCGSKLKMLWAPCVNRLLLHNVEILIKWMHISLSLTAVLSVTLISVAAYAISDVFWVSQVVGWLMWASIISILVGCCILLICVLGVHAARRRITPALTVNRAFLFCTIVILFLAGVLVCALAGGVQSLVDLSWPGLEDALPPGTSVQTFVRNAREKYLVLGSVLAVLAIWLIIPFLLNCSILEAVRRERIGGKGTPAGLSQTEAELRLTLRESILFAIFFGLVIVSYAIHGVLFCMRAGLSSIAGIMFLQLACGFALLIALVVGIWASFSVDINALQLHLLALVPCELFLTIWSCIALSNIEYVAQFIVDHWDDINIAEGENQIYWQTRVKILLLVGAVLGFSTCSCLISTLFAGFCLRNHLFAHGVVYRDKWSMDRHHCLIRLTRIEWILIFWGISTGLTSVFLEGTFAVFNGFVKTSSAWPTSFWRTWGEVDSRYIDGNSYVVVMELVTALVIGPSCLVYSWAVYSRKSFRHILGICLSTCSVFAQVFYIATEVYSDFSHTFSNGKIEFWFGFVFVTLLRVIIPLMVLVYNMKHVYVRVKAAEIQFAKLLGEHQLLRRIDNYRQVSDYQNECLHQDSIRHHLSP